MSFMDAVKSVLTQYVGFSGRARRSEYWFFVLFNILVSIVASIIGGLIKFPLLATLVSLALLLPALAVSVRRLHDTGRTGWWLLIGLIPLVGLIVLIVFFVQDSNPGQNAYGPNPKGAAAATTATA
jgi:uncharacterized membrane protein YhaH (DUF805 family)